MRALVMISSLAFTIIMATGVLTYVWRYFTSVEFANRQTRRTHFFVLLPLLSLILSSTLFAYDLYAWQERFPMSTAPIERLDSVQKTAAFFIITLTACIGSWNYFRRRENVDHLPNPLIIAFLSGIAVFSSLAWIYFSYVGYCCDTSGAVFAGFPFSALYGSYGSNYSFYDNLKNLSFLQILQAYRNQLYWTPRPLAILVDFLFWSNLILLAWVSFSLIVTGRGVQAQLE